MSLISGDDQSFFSRMGKSVEIGDHCESLVHAAATLAFPKSEGWHTIRQFRPKYNDSSIGEEGLSRDKFDLLIFQQEEKKDSISNAIVVQVTKYRDLKETEEESNKNYEALETLEEFYFLGSRTRSNPNEVLGLPGTTLFGNICFGNRRMTRKWIPTQQELSLDFLIYPCYGQRGIDALPDCGWEAELLDFWIQSDKDPNQMIAILQSEITNKISVTGIIGSRITKYFEKLMKDKLPMNPIATSIFQARSKYRQTERYRRDVEFLMSQIEAGGMPASRFKLKKELISGSDSDYPDEWDKIMKEITRKLAIKRPHVHRGFEMYSDGTMKNYLSALEENDFDYLITEFNSSDLDRRKATRLALLRIANLPIEDLHQMGANEQNYTTISLSEKDTRSIIKIISERLQTEQNGENKDIKKSNRLAMNRVFQGIRYDAVNGTSMVPCKWALEYLIKESGLPKFKAVKSPESFIIDVIDSKNHEELQVFNDMSIKEVIGSAYKMRPQFKFEVDGQSIFIQTKPVDGEQNRRAKEEGCKVWTCFSKAILNQDGSSYHSGIKDNYWIYIDGEWNQIDILLRMIECGIRVYLSPFSVIENLKNVNK